MCGGVSCACARLTCRFEEQMQAHKLKTYAGIYQIEWLNVKKKKKEDIIHSTGQHCKLSLFLFLIYPIPTQPFVLLFTC